ncbi:oxidoreductase [Streptomyces lavendulae]|uniref:oxidoreductase n=1 Tax=Streptomyces lavendulae TaxID=1914 RepID=UPI003719465C
MVAYEELSTAERLVWDAFPEGHPIDLRLPGPDGGVPEPAVRASVLKTLLLGEGDRPRGAVPAVRLSGARITGPLDLSGAELAHALLLEDCRLEGEFSLYGAATRTVSLLDCTLAGGIDACMARVEGRLELKGSRLAGALLLRNARISGELFLDRAEITADGRWALDAGGLDMGGGVWACKGFTAHGGVRLPGATLPGGLFLSGARLHPHPSGTALHAANVIASTLVLSDGFTAHGAVDLRGAQVSGSVTFEGAVLKGADTAVDGSLMRAAVLDFTPAEPPSAAVDLRDARIEALRDRPGSWPATVLLQGLVYGSLPSGGGDRHEVGRRVEWIRREPGYAPQPYEQLAAWYRKVGHDDDARRVLLFKQRHRRRAMNPAGRLWSHVLDVTVGFGYRPWLAGVWLAALTALGTAVFGSRTPTPVQSGQGPRFSALVYSLDLLVPIGNLGQRSAWYWTAPAVQWVAYALIAAGWLLTTAAVAGVTRTLSKN